MFETDCSVNSQFKVGHLLLQDISTDEMEKQLARGNAVRKIIDAREVAYDVGNRDTVRVERSLLSDKIFNIRLFPETATCLRLPERS